MDMVMGMATGMVTGTVMAMVHITATGIAMAEDMVMVANMEQGMRSPMTI